MNNRKPCYQNSQHYIIEGWSNQPKKFFLDLRDIIHSSNISDNSKLLDVGCATGELINFLLHEFENFNFTGIDVSEELIQNAQQNLPKADFKIASILDLPKMWQNQFDVVTVCGVLSIFDENELETAIDNLLRVTRKGGHIFILSPFNEYGIDAVIKHRKKVGNISRNWETGWNIYSIETIKEFFISKCENIKIIPFNINCSLPPKLDPIRTWTVNFQNNPFQLMNGLKLLINHYFVCINK